MRERIQSGFDIESQNDPLGRMAENLGVDDFVDPSMYNDPDIEHITSNQMEEFNKQF